MTEIKTRKISKTLGISFLFAAFIFYFLPDFIIIDPLPDIIGYILISLGLTMLSDICDEIAVAKKRFMYMIILGGARLLSVIAVFSLFSENERPTALLTFSFILATAECILLISAYSKLFEGLLYLGTRHEGIAVFAINDKKRKRSYTDTIKRFTYLFIIIKNTFAVLPEFLSLSVGNDLQSYTYERYDDINILRVFSIIFVTVIGIIWLCRTIKYFKRVLQDAPFIEKLKEKYRVEVLPNEYIFLRRRINIAFLLFSIAALLSVDFYISLEETDGINVIPDFICALFFIAGTIVLFNKKSRRCIIAIATSAVYGIITAFTWKAYYNFDYEYTAREILRDPVPNDLWNFFTTVSVFEATSFIVMIISICYLLSETIDNNTGYLPTHATINPAESYKELHHSLNIKLIICFIIAAIAACCGPFRVYLFCSDSFISNIAWIIEAVLSGAFAITFILSLNNIKEKIEEKYLFS